MSLNVVNLKKGREPFLIINEKLMFSVVETVVLAQLYKMIL